MTVTEKDRARAARFIRAATSSMLVLDSITHWVKTGEWNSGLYVSFTRDYDNLAQQFAEAREEGYEQAERDNS